MYEVYSNQTFLSPKMPLGCVKPNTLEIVRKVYHRCKIKQNVKTILKGKVIKQLHTVFYIKAKYKENPEPNSEAVATLEDLRYLNSSHKQFPFLDKVAYASI